MITVGPHRYTLDDVRGSVAALGDWWLQLTAGRAAIHAEPAAWSMAHAVAAIIKNEVTEGSLEAELHRLGAAARHAVDRDLAGPLMEATLQGVEAMTAALRAADQIPAAGNGVVAQLSRSGGGVPKLPVSSVTVGLGGLEGDAQKTRRHHGRPWQALCLWSAEVIDWFAAAGHPIGYGSAGENITIAGLEWPEMRAGVRLRIGSVLAELSLFALPCSQNAQWFLGRDHTVMHHDRGPVSRIYAWVREPGAIAAGEPVTVVR